MRSQLGCLLNCAMAGALLVGMPAPKFACKAHTGSTVSLSDYEGKSVLLWFSLAGGRPRPTRGRAPFTHARTHAHTRAHTYTRAHTTRARTHADRFYPRALTGG